MKIDFESLTLVIVMVIVGFVGAYKQGTKHSTLPPIVDHSNNAICVRDCNQ